LLGITVFAAFAPPSNLDHPILLAALAAIAAVGYSVKIWLEPDDDASGGGTTFDATAVTAMVALWVGGPVPAIAVWLIPDLLHRFVFGRSGVLTRGLALNVLSFAAGSLAGGAILLALHDALGVFLAGAVMVAINFALSPLLYALLFEGPEERRVLLRELVALTPVIGLMLVAGTATAVLTEHAGVLALVLLAVVVALPEIRWRQVAERFPAARPDREPGLADGFAAAEELLEMVLAQVEGLTQAPSRPRDAWPAHRSHVGPPTPRRRGDST
jgi:hypothetical protein